MHTSASVSVGFQSFPLFEKIVTSFELRLTATSANVGTVRAPYHAQVSAGTNGCDPG